MLGINPLPLINKKTSLGAGLASFFSFKTNEKLPFDTEHFKGNELSL